MKIKKNSVAILAKKKSDCIALLNDLKINGMRKREVFLSWEDIWLSEIKNDYDYILIDYCFFDKFRDDIVCYHLFHRYKSKITFYSNISQNIETQDGGVGIDLYRIFFRPFVDFKDVTTNCVNNNILIGGQDVVTGIDLEKNNTLRSRSKDDFFLKEGYSLTKFYLNEILCVESERNYVTIYLSSGKHLIRQTLQSILEALPEEFYQINRSVVINLDKIDKIMGNRVYVNGLNNFHPIISNKYKRDILNAVPLFNETLL